MPSIKMIIAYDGTPYFGWQKTKDGPSIEEELAKVLEIIFQHPILLDAASRTDAGVHAKAQVVKFKTEKEIDNLQKLLISLNQLLPSTIAVKDLSFSTEAFHPTLDATDKIYEYLVTTTPFLCPFKRNTHWHIPKKLDYEMMQKASRYFFGIHDFQSFTNDREPPYENTHREIYDIIINDKESDFQFLIQGNHFLYKMVRNIVGTLIYVGLGKLHADEIPAILAARSRPLAGMTAPAKGLSLLSVGYSPSSEALLQTTLSQTTKNFSFIPPLSNLGDKVGS